MRVERGIQYLMSVFVSFPEEKTTLSISNHVLKLKMNIYIDLILVALVTIYIVDISGFTESWRGWCADILHISKLRPLPPFDCGKCMTWWVCLIYAICVGQISLGTIAFSALLSHLSNPLGEGLIFIREWITWIFDKLMP